MKILNLKRHLALLCVGLLYGGNFSMIKVVTPRFVLPLGFIVYRVMIAAIVFWILGFSLKEKVNWKADGWLFVLCALFGVGINMLMFFQGVSMTSAINASIIMTLTPVLIFITSLIILKERITTQKVLGLSIGMLGAFVIIYRPDTQSTGSSWLGDLLVLLNAMSYGTYLVLVKPLLRKYQPLTITKWIFLIGFFLVLPVGYNQAIVAKWSEISTETFVSFLYVILGVTVIAYLTNIWAMKKVNPSTVGAYIYVQPVFATVTASLFFEEILSLRHLMAALLVFAGVWLVIKSE